MNPTSSRTDGINGITIHLAQQGDNRGANIFHPAMSFRSGRMHAIFEPISLAAGTS